MIVLGAGALVVVVIGGVLLLGGGSGGANGLTSSYSCSGPAGFSSTINFSSTGNADGRNLAGTAEGEGEQETFSDGQIRNGAIDFGNMSNSQDDPGDLVDGGRLLSNGDITLSSEIGEVLCTPS